MGSGQQRGCHYDLRGSLRHRRSLPLSRADCRRPDPGKREPALLLPERKPRRPPRALLLPPKARQPDPVWIRMVAMGTEKPGERRKERLHCRQGARQPNLRQRTGALLFYSACARPHFPQHCHASRTGRGRQGLHRPGDSSPWSSARRGN